jgi:hypothetical protein
MIKIPFTEADIDALRSWRFHHPDPRVQVRMEALYLRSQQVSTRDIRPLCGLSKASFHRSLKPEFAVHRHLRRAEPLCLQGRAAEKAQKT